MRILTQRLGRIISAFLLLSVFSARSAVIINEIYYHPVTTNLLEEWFELYNPGPTNVNISGWRMTKGVSVAFPTNTTINAGGFLVVAADVPTFSALHLGHNDAIERLRTVVGPIIHLVQ